MRSRKPANEQVAEVARRRLELLGEELAGIRRNLPNPALHRSDGPGVLDPADAPWETCPVEDERVHVEARAGTSMGTSIGTSTGPQSRPRERPGRHAQRSVGLSATVVGWAHDRLPPTLQGRVQLGSSHLTVVALLVAAALAVTAWSVVRADDSGTPIPATAREHPLSTPSALVPVAETGPGSSATQTPSASASAMVVIDVVGKVRRPGIATLPLGSRVVDAIRAAGGARHGVNVHALNLARLLVDGEQILVGVPPAAGVAAPAASVPGAAPLSSAALVNLNTATQMELEELPNVGPVTALAIMQWRTENGAFTAVDELLEVSGIGDATLADLAPFVTL